MPSEYNLDRFLAAQESMYFIALSEIKNGRKQSHWMWYIFPQLKGLGLSEKSKLYAIDGRSEADQYLNHPILGGRLVEISNELLKLKDTSAYQIFGRPDDIKLQSSITLFCCVDNANPVFLGVLDKYFNGVKDERTLQLFTTDTI